MNARDLIEMLQDLDPYTEIRIAHQPNYPFELSIENMAKVGEGVNQVAYLGEGSQIGYLPQEAAVALGWAEADNQNDEFKPDKEYDQAEERRRIEKFGNK